MCCGAIRSTETELAPAAGAAHPPRGVSQDLCLRRGGEEPGPQIRPAILAPVPAAQGQLRLLVQGHGRELEINLHQLIAWLMGTGERRRAIPWFRAVYVVLSLALFLIVGTLIWHGLEQLYLLLCGTQQNRLGAFSAIIFLTLALAVFDLGKTILEEEVLLHKDIFRHSAIRTITRFIAAILIAVSIEGLLLLFKDPSARANCSGLRWG